MELARAWRRRLLGGLAASVAVPGVIVAAGVATGGLGGFRALGQAITGPVLPLVAPALPARAADDDTSRLLARIEPPAPAVAAARARADGSGPADRAPAGRRNAPGRGQNRGGGGAPPSSGGGGTAPPAPAPPAPPPAPAPAPTPAPEPPSTIRQVGDTLKDVTDQVPVAGEPAGEVVDVIVETVETLPLP